MGRRHYGGDVAGKSILTAGLGGMGGAQPLAATMAGASLLAIECGPARIAKRLDTRYLDVRADSLDAALAMNDGTAYTSPRPSFAQLIDAQMAAVIDHERTAWETGRRSSRPTSSSARADAVPPGRECRFLLENNRELGVFGV